MCPPHAEEADELDRLVTAKTESVQYSHPNHTVTVTTISDLDLSGARLLGLPASEVGITSQPWGRRDTADWLVRVAKFWSMPWGIPVQGLFPIWAPFRARMTSLTPGALRGQRHHQAVGARVSALPAFPSPSASVCLLMAAPVSWDRCEDESGRSKSSS